MTESEAYVPGFQYDLFISYAHVDNVDSWVHRFHEELKKILARRVGRIGKLRIWYDAKLDGSQAFDDVLKDRIERSAVFVALLSKGYLESDYCTKELAWFHTHARKSRHGIQIGERRRSLHVLLTDVPIGDWPEVFGGAKGFPLHDAEDAESDDRIGEPSESGGDRFKQQLRALADAVYRLLEEFRKQEDRSPSDSPTPGYVFLADAADSLQDLRERLVSDLRQKGREVVADIPPPFESSEHTIAVGAALSKAILSVHLLDALPGRKITNESPSTYPKKQVELGIDSATAQLIWVPKALEIGAIPSEDHRAFLEELERGERGEKSYDFVKGEDTDLLHVILEKLEQLERRPVTTEGTNSVLLDTHLKDQRFAFQLGEYLLGQGLQPFIHQETDDPEANLRAFEDRLARVETLVVLFGQVSLRWVESRLESVLQFVARQVVDMRRASLEGCYVCLLPPGKKPETLRFAPRFFKVDVLDNSASDELRPEILAPLFAGRAGGGVS